MTRNGRNNDKISRTDFRMRQQIKTKIRPRIGKIHAVGRGSGEILTPNGIKAIRKQARLTKISARGQKFETVEIRNIPRRQ